MSTSSPWLFEAPLAAAAAPCRCGGCRQETAFESEWEIASVPAPPPNPASCDQCVQEFLNSRLEGNERIARLRVCLAGNGCR